MDDYIITELCGNNEKFNKIVDDIENGCRLYLHFENLSTFFSMEDYLEDDSIYDIEITILSDKILNYDMPFFDKERKNNKISSYRPYFINFLFPIKKIDLYNKLLNLNKCTLDNNTWFIGIIGKNLDIEDENKKIFLEGTLQIGYDSIVSLKRQLVIFKDQTLNKKKVEQINSMYEFSYVPLNNSKISSVLNEVWNNDLLETLDIYNVGHGNMDYIRGEKSKILYDIGYHYRHIPNKKSLNFYRAVNAIHYMKPSAVIISHWDMDHYIGYVCATTDIFSCPWIVPNLKNESKNAKRLARYLYLMGKLYIVDEKKNTGLIAKININADMNISLLQGKGIEKGISKKNCNGIMLEIKSPWIHVLLAADVPYQCIPTYVKLETIDYLHVPHHCRKMNLNKLNSISGKSINNRKLAIISDYYAKNKTNLDHKKKLECIFEDVLYTSQNEFSSTNENLSIQIDLKGKTHKIR